MQTRTFHLHTLSALHIGTGQGVDAVDLPIARSRATHLPIVPGSALKGVLRDAATEQWQKDEKDITALFGKEAQANDPTAGAVAFGDAHLLLLPVRSFAGLFAYATCPFILHRYARDTDLNASLIPAVHDQATVCPQSCLFPDSQNQTLALEDLDIAAQQSQQAAQIAQAIAQAVYPDQTAQADYWREAMCQRFVILPDGIFSFLADTATEIRTRVRINSKTRIVDDGALWSEENLPVETVLWGQMGIHNERKQDGKSAADLSALLPEGEHTVQIGGKHTVGRGLCRLLLDAANRA